MMPGGSDRLGGWPVVAKRRFACQEPRCRATNHKCCPGARMLRATRPNRMNLKCLATSCHKLGSSCS